MRRWISVIPIARGASRIFRRSRPRRRMAAAAGRSRSATTSASDAVSSAGALRTIVADASALLEYLLQTDRSAPIRDALRQPDADLGVPALCDIEVAAGLRGALLRDLISIERAEQALAHYLILPLTRHGHEGLLPRVLGLRSNFSAYDACHVALAELLGAELLTADERRSRAVRTYTTVGVLP